jgi:hypothetical protein
MSDISPTLLVAIGLLLAAWTAAAGWIMLRASTRVAHSEGSRKAVRRLARMIEDAPAIPMLVRADGRIEAPDRLAGWLGLESLPQYLGELAPGDGKGLSPDQVADLSEAVRLAARPRAAWIACRSRRRAERIGAGLGVRFHRERARAGAASP